MKLWLIVILALSGGIMFIEIILLISYFRHYKFMLVQMKRDNPKVVISKRELESILEENEHWRKGKQADLQK